MTVNLPLAMLAATRRFPMPIRHNPTAVAPPFSAYSHAVEVASGAPGGPSQRGRSARNGILLTYLRGCIWCGLVLLGRGVLGEW